MQPKYEIVGNFHLHTNHSDGAGNHEEVARAAAEAGLDAIMYTDHNVCTPDQEGWYTHPQTGRQVLLLMGEGVPIQQAGCHCCCLFPRAVCARSFS